MVPENKSNSFRALFPCGDRLVCIIDDREDVWNFASNVVHVKPYRYFKHTGDINAPPGFSKNGQSREQSTYETFVPKGANEQEPAEKDGASTSTESNVTEDAVAKGEESFDTAIESDGQDQDQDDDDYLYHLEDILARIHAAFYQMQEQMPPNDRPPDLKSVMPYVKNKILRKCNIVFSGVVPTNVPIETSSVYKAAVSFGAQVQKDIVAPYHPGRHRKTAATTHLVAAKWGTAKVYQARKTGSAIKIVTPQWLWCCVERWEREDERLFLLTKESETPESKRQERQPYGEKSESGDSVGDVDICVISDDRPASTSSPLLDDDQGLELDAGEDNFDLDYEPTKKMAKNETESEDEENSSSSSSSATSVDKKEGTEDDEMVEALERELE